MIELVQDAFSKIAPLYQAEAKHFPLILAVIQKKQRGWVFVDDPNEPASAMVITNFGFMQIFGRQDLRSFDRNVANFFIKEDHGTPSYLLWYSPPPQWQRKLDVLVSNRVRRRERARFIFQKQLADYLTDLVKAPSGFGLRSLDDDLIEKTRVLNLDIDFRFWASKDDFLKNGFGVCLIKNDEVVSLCYSACIVDGLAEIEIATRDEYQGRGFGAITAKYFIQKCTGIGISPTWDCFVSNDASMKLAAKLGFTQVDNYLFYSFTIPIEFTEST